MKTIMLSLGGSVIHPDAGIDTKFLSQFNKLIRKQVAKGRRFFIMVGGGHIGREYQQTAKDVRGKITNNDLDWLGIHGTRLNAHLIRTIFHDIAAPRLIIGNVEEKLNGKEKVYVGAGGKPGVSTDYYNVRLVEKFKPGLIVHLLNVKQIYDRDPRVFPEARPIKSMSWAAYRRMIGDWWTSERQLPFDPFAAKLAQKMGLKIIFTNGKNLENLERIFEGKSFKGTVIE